MTRRTQNLTAEKTVIGFMIRSDAAYWALADAQIGEDHFSDPTYRLFFCAIRDICTEGKRLTTQLLQSRLPDTCPDDTSTIAHMAVLVKQSEDAGSVVDYLDDLREAFRWRKLAQLAAVLNSAPSDKTIDDILAEVDAGVKDLSATSTAGHERTLAATVQSVLAKAAAAYRDGVPIGYDTGLPSLDEIIGPLMPGDLVVFGASQGEGKTAAALQVGMHLTSFGPVAFFELEMEGEGLARRLLAAESGVNLQTIKTGAFDGDEYTRLDQAGRCLASAPLVIIDRRMTMRQLRARALSLKASRNIVALIIDHLRLIQIDKGIKVNDRFDRFEYVTGELKALAKELGVPVILLAQRTIGSQDRDNPEPRVNDLFSGGALQQDSDIIVIFWRKDRWLQQRRPRQDDEKKFAAWQAEMHGCEGYIEASCVKYRDGPAMEKRRFRFNGPKTRLEEVNA